MGYKEDHPDLFGTQAGGRIENFGFRIRDISIGSAEIQLPVPGVTAIVGGNNVGKTTSLRQIIEALDSGRRARSDPPMVVTRVGDPWYGSVVDLGAWLERNGTFHRQQGSDWMVTSGGARVALRYVRHFREQQEVSSLRKMFLDLQSPFDRLALSDPVPAPERSSDPPTHAIHLLRKDEELREELFSAVEQIFGIKLGINSVNPKLFFYIGTPSVPAPPMDSPTREYMEALESLPDLASQGDGVRAAVGLLMTLIADSRPVIMFDEPEAFLHPPQARMLGRAVARIASQRSRQVVLATHDKNLLRGLTEGGGDLAILHLSREGDISSARMLTASQTAELWQDPVLRYTNALDGLFSSAVIVTENDRDSVFYEAAIDHVLENEQDARRLPDILFLSGNGKDGIAPIVARLRELGVKVVSTVDLDILNDEGKLKRLVESHGGDWSSLSSVYRRATAEFRQAVSSLTRRDAMQLIKGVLENEPDQPLTNADRGAIRSKIATKSKWEDLKSYGEVAFKADLAASTALLSSLDELGIIAVRVGVLERFVRDENVTKGVRWLPEALTRGAHRTDAAAAHARRLLVATGFLEARRLAASPDSSGTD